MMALTLGRFHVPRPRSTVQVVLTICTATALLLGAVAVAMFSVGHLDALTAAGAFKGTPIPGVQSIVERLKGNLVWLGGTAMGLVISVVALMHMAGHSRAHDTALKALAGIAILASISGIVA